MNGPQRTNRNVEALLEETCSYLMQAADCLYAAPVEQLFTAAGDDIARVVAQRDRRMRGCVTVAKAIRSSLRIVCLAEGVAGVNNASGVVARLVGALAPGRERLTVRLLAQHHQTFQGADFWCDLDEPITCAATDPRVRELASLQRQSQPTLGAADSATVAGALIASAYGDNTPTLHSVCATVAYVHSVLTPSQPAHRRQ